jgi:hypothetical protein
MISIRVNIGMEKQDILFYLKINGIIPVKDFFADPGYWRGIIDSAEFDAIRPEPPKNQSAYDILFAPLEPSSAKPPSV